MLLLSVQSQIWCTRWANHDYKFCQIDGRIGGPGNPFWIMEGILKYKVSSTIPLKRQYPLPTLFGSKVHADAFYIVLTFSLYFNVGLVLNLCWQLAKILFLRDKNLSFFLSILQKLFEVNLYNYLVESDSFLNSFCTISPGTNKAACVWMMHHSSSKRCYFLDPSFDEKCFFVVFYIMNKTQVKTNPQFKF